MKLRTLLALSVVFIFAIYTEAQAQQNTPSAPTLSVMDSAAAAVGCTPKTVVEDSLGRFAGGVDYLLDKPLEFVERVYSVADGAYNINNLQKINHKLFTNVNPHFNKFLQSFPNNTALNQALKARGLDAAFDARELAMLQGRYAQAVRNGSKAANFWGAELNRMRGAASAYTNALKGLRTVSGLDFVIAGIQGGNDALHAFDAFRQDRIGQGTEHTIKALSAFAGIPIGIAGGVVGYKASRLATKRKIPRFAIGVGSKIATGYIWNNYSKTLAAYIRYKVEGGFGFIEYYDCPQNTIFIEMSAAKLWDGNGKAPDPFVCLGHKCKVEDRDRDKKRGEFKQCKKNTNYCFIPYNFDNHRQLLVDVWDLDFAKDDHAGTQTCTIRRDKDRWACDLDKAKVYFIRAQMSPPPSKPAGGADPSFPSPPHKPDEVGEGQFPPLPHKPPEDGNDPFRPPPHKPPEEGVDPFPNPPQKPPEQEKPFPLPPEKPAEEGATGSKPRVIEHDTLNITSLLAYPASIKKTMLVMGLSGLSDDSFLFDEPKNIPQFDNYDRYVFHKNGGGAPYRFANAKYMVSGEKGRWVYTSSWRMDFGANKRDTSKTHQIFALLPNVNQKACLLINATQNLNSGTDSDKDGIPEGAIKGHVFPDASHNMVTDNSGVGPHLETIGHVFSGVSYGCYDLSDSNGISGDGPFVFYYKLF